MPSPEGFSQVSPAFADEVHALLAQLPRAHEHPRGVRGEPPEVGPGRLVRAVLRPHHGEHGQFQVGGVAPQELDDRRQLVVGQPEPAVDRLHEARVSAASVPEME